METAGVISLGCARNWVDSEVILGSLQKAGYHLSKDPAACDILIVNTCGFIGEAKKESVEAVLEMAAFKKTGRLKKLVMAGCLAQRYSETLAKEMPEVDLFIGTGDFPRVAELLEGNAAGVHVGKPRLLADETLPRLIATPKHTAYLKLAEGCQHACSFCIIPKLRGPLRSRSIPSLVTEAESLLALGVKELNLIAQDSTGYGRDLRDGTTLKKLLEALTRLPGEKWLRLFYAYPHGFPMEVVDFMRETPDVCNYLDLPVQHISDPILKSMRRGGTSRDIRRLLDTLREKIPQITLRTTLIVGYPGETEKDFRALESFVDEGYFDHVGIFTYSEEEGTTAARMKDDVPRKIKRERKKRLMEIQQTISLQKNKTRVGETLEILVEGNTGRHEGQAPDVDGVVFLEGNLPPAGTFTTVKITGAEPYDLKGTTNPDRPGRG